MTTLPLEKVLKDRFGYGQFRPGQREAIEALLRDGAALAIFPTGGGKSLCYQLTALVIEGVTLVVSPLIALMKDQIGFLKRRGIEAERLDSSLSADEVRAINRRLRNGELRILFVAPERFNNERFLADLGHVEIGLLAIDEAHCISEWGHNFRPDYLKLAKIRQDIRAQRVLALTATATPKVANDICEAFHIAPAGLVKTGFYRPNLVLLTTPCHAKDRFGVLLGRLQARPKGPTIVYVTLQRQAEELAAFLSQHGFSALAYHAGMTSDERNRVQDQWMGAEAGVVVATIAFGMGIDRADVRYVYHANLPKSLESYGQEIGRAGRDGQESIVELLASTPDITTLENFVYGDAPSEVAIRSLVNELLAQPEEFSISAYDLSARHDLRPLVLRTTLTYLEMEGALLKGTPYYAGYEFRPLVRMESIGEAFPDPHGKFALSLFRVAKRGRTWYGMDPASAAEQLGVERKRVTRALEVMGEKGLIELRASDVRDRYTRLVDSSWAERLIEDLVARFQKRESQELDRLRQVVDLVELDRCQVEALVGYFGETLGGPCGHCTYCLSGAAAQMPEFIPKETIEDRVSRPSVAEFVGQHPDVFHSPRQVARFLCGLTTPSFSRNKISRSPLFGILDQYRFQAVEDWWVSGVD